MLKLVMIIAVVVLAIAPNTATADVDVISSSVVMDKNVGVAITVTNGYHSPVTALLIEARQYSSSGRLTAVHANYQDVYVNHNHDQPLPPGATRTVRLLAPEALRTGRIEVHVSAALFEDGATFGAREGIEILQGRRTSVQRSIDEVIGYLQAAQDRALGRAELLAGLDTVRAKARAFVPTSPAENITRAVDTLVPTIALNELAMRGTVCSDGPCTRQAVSSILIYLGQWKRWLAAAPR